MNTQLKRKNLFSYGLMALPLAFAGLPIYLHAPDFYAGTLGQSLTSLGLLLLALRAVDAIQDPLIGSLSDRYHQHRALILVLGVMMLGGGFWMLFHPHLSTPLTWFAMAMFICTTGFSIVSINLQTLGGIWQVSEHQRTRITSWREALGLLGLLTAAMGPALLGANSDPSTAFHRLTIAYLPLLAVATWALLVWMKTAPLTRPQKAFKPSGESDGETRGHWRALINNPWRRRFFALFALNTLASAIPAVLVLFFIRDRLGAAEYSGLFLLVYFLFGALAMPLWQWLSKRVGKIQAWAVSMALSIITFLWAVFLQDGQVEAYVLVCALSGLALGADLALPPSILADHIAAEKSQAEASRMFSLMTLLSKASLALATGLALPLLGLAGYQPGIAMTAELNLTLSLFYAALPCILKTITLVWLLRQANHIAQATSLQA
ncbi:MFS transporter [uncultured Roseibium sp.]|uniref:MFS transporter n=1 Tax=uncultured Roseibium sp. TaxID=1936171 RepID=UPI0025978CCD|nr:MFS transporter [uncultured Roseibium sp.]